MTGSLVDRYAEALVDQTFDDYPLHHDVVFRGPRLGPVQGEGPVREVLVRIAQAFASFQVTSRGHLVEGDQAVLFLGVGLPDGRGFAIADHLAFEAGRLVLIRPYFDAGLLEELGAAPSVAELGTGAWL